LPAVVQPIMGTRSARRRRDRDVRGDVMVDNDRALLAWGVAPDACRTTEGRVS
jgi:hypothetical protein